MSIKHKVGQLDVANAGWPILTIVKPVISNAAEHAPSILNRMAAHGPRYRVGLVPSARSRRWDFNDEPGWWCTQSVDISGQHSMQEILDHVAGQRLAVPISVSQAGEYLCLYTDHGVGAPHLALEVLAALTRGQPDTGFAEPLEAPTITNPLASTLFDVAKATPLLFVRGAIGLWKPAWSFFRRNVAALVNRPRMMLSRPAGDQDQDERYVAVWSKSDPEFIEEVRRYRDSKHPSVSVTAILMLLICRALQECGVSLHDELGVVVDLRRFLPRNNFTLANFYGTAYINIGTQPSVDEFGASLRLTAGSLHTLFREAAYLGVNRVRMLFARRTRKTGQRLRRPAKSTQSILTISTVVLPAFAKIAWARPDDAEIAIAGQPGDQSRMSIFICITPNGSVQLTATFYASHIDKSLVARGLSRALSSVALKQRLETISGSS